jgi:hypothetical protein
MRYRRLGPALLITAAALAICGVTAVAMFFTDRLLTTSYDGDYELMRDIFHAELDAFQDEALHEAEIVVAIPAVRKAFLDRDRPRLLAETRPMFAVQAEKYGVDRAEFHEPPGISFLRLHRPEKFGDDQTSYRPVLAEAHRQKAIRQGVEITRSGPGVSAIVPILDDAGKLSGTFEMALDFAPLFDELKTTYEFESALFLEERLLREVATELPEDVTSVRNRVGPYIRFHTTHDELLKSLVSDHDVDVTEPRSYERTVSGITWGVQLIPLYNHAHQQIGVVSLANNFGKDRAAARRAFVWQGLAALFAVVLLAGAVLVVIRGWLLAPLAALNERFAALAKGEEAIPARDMEDQCEEIRKLAESYEELRRGREP